MKTGEKIADWPAVESQFLEALADQGNVSGAALAAGISRRTAYNRRDNDIEFARKWDDALEVACDALEAEARRRAYKGVPKPVFYQGDICGHVQEYSDTLMIVLLKAHRPDRFRENAKVEHEGGLTIRVEYADANPDDPAPEAASEPG